MGGARTHLQKYGASYLYGAIFAGVAFTGAIVAEFQHLTHEQIAAMTRFDWFIGACAVLAATGTTLLAFLNKTYSAAQGGQPPAEPPAAARVVMVPAAASPGSSLGGPTSAEPAPGSLTGGHS